MFRVCPSHSTLRVAIEYRWADGHFRSHPAAERIKNVDQAIVGFVESFSVPSITAGIAAGANYLLVVRKERAERSKIGSLVPTNSRPRPG